MKAIVIDRYGPPEVARLTEINKPVPRKNEVLVRVMASTVNRTDAAVRGATNILTRMWSGLRRPSNPVLGCEFSGIIEETGASASRFKKGERVFGFNSNTFGGHAEYLTIRENAAIHQVPRNLSLAEAAAITEGAHYALSNIKASGIVQGQRALVNGATGAIGSAAVQILKHFGVHVTAVCNTKNLGLIRSLGADVVISYQTANFTDSGEQYHFIFDAVGKSTFKDCKPLLTEQGVYISTEPGDKGKNIIQAVASTFRKGKKVRFPIPRIGKEEVEYLYQLVESNAFRPLIDRHYSMDQIVEAYRYVDSGGKTGNVILKIAQSAFPDTPAQPPIHLN